MSARAASLLAAIALLTPITAWAGVATLTTNEAITLPLPILAERALGGLGRRMVEVLRPFGLAQTLRLLSLAFVGKPLPSGHDGLCAAELLVVRFEPADPAERRNPATFADAPMVPVGISVAQLYRVIGPLGERWAMPRMDTDMTRRCAEAGPTTAFFSLRGENMPAEALAAIEQVIADRRANLGAAEPWSCKEGDDGPCLTTRILRRVELKRCEPYGQDYCLEAAFGTGRELALRMSGVTFAVTGRGTATPRLAVRYADATVSEQSVVYH